MRVRTALWSHYLHIGFFSSSFTFHFFSLVPLFFFKLHCCGHIVVVAHFFSSPSISLFAFIVHFHCFFFCYLSLLLAFTTRFCYSLSLLALVTCFCCSLLLSLWLCTFITCLAHFNKLQLFLVLACY